MHCSMSEVPYKYFMTVSPLDGKLYISDYQSKRIIRVKTMGAVRDLTQNMEIVAGTGDQCVPGDRHKCGDNSSAVNANLFYPKGRNSPVLNSQAVTQSKQALFLILCERFFISF